MKTKSILLGLGLVLSLSASAQQLNGSNTFTGENIFSNNLFLSTVGTWGDSPIKTELPRLYFGAANDNSYDGIFFTRYNTAFNNSELRLYIGDGGDTENNDKFAIGPAIWNATNNTNTFSHRFVVTAGGRVGIGVENPQNALDVNGTIRAKEVRVESGWADFVFAKDYKLPSLDEVKAHIDEHKHLPGIPSEDEVKENGVGLSEISTKLLQKVEELTLYAIQQKETIEKLNKRIDELEKSKE